MSLRPRLGSRLALIGFTAVWLTCLVMVYATLERGTSVHVYVGVWGSGDDYPVVERFTDGDDETTSRLRPGDRLIRVGDWDLRGRNQIGTVLRVVDTGWRTDGDIPFVVERDGERLSVMEPRGMEPGPWPRIRPLVAVVWGIAAILIAWRAPRTPSTRALVGALASNAIIYTAAFQGPIWIFALSVAVSAVIVLLAQPLFLRGMLAFPDEAYRLEGWNRIWPWAFAAVGVLFFSAEANFPIPASDAAPWAPWAAIFYAITAGWVLTNSYRRCGPVGRRRVKWVLYSVYVGVLIVIPAYVVAGAEAATPPLGPSIALAVGSCTFPIALLIAVLRFDLLDIDRLIGATVAYNFLVLVAVGIGLLVTPGITEFLASEMTIDPAVGRSGVALGLAGVVMVVQRRVRPQIDRLFFRERFSFEQAMHDLPDLLADCADAEQLWETLGAQLVEHLRPSACALFATAGDTFVPVFAAAEVVPPAIPTESGLVRWFDGKDGALTLDRKAVRSIDGVGQAVVANLEARIAVPIQRRRSLEAFLLLGEKKSGDIYTRTDLVLLTSLAKALSIHLLRFDEADLLSRSRAIQEKMRRYVPGAVAEQIAQGQDLEAGEREVTVLFVDIRGYTALSDGRDASTIFSTVNRYTETVSSVVGEHGGAVVEFNGDGMMAVFGAPRPLPDKERAAVATAKRLVSVVGALPLEPEGSERLSVGVGIATGRAFVGNIESVDRIIWTAIGSTINLAARLQSLTRQMDADVLIDETTHERAGAEAHGALEHPDVPIRGKSDLETVFAIKDSGPSPSPSPRA